MAKANEFILPYESFSSFQKKGNKEMTMTLLRGGEVAFPFTFLISEDFQESYFYAKKVFLSLLWAIGGSRFLFRCEESFFSYFKERILTDDEVVPSLKAIEGIYGEAGSLDLIGELPPKNVKKRRRNLSSSGCRIGLDLGGSDLKAMAIRSGEIVYSSESIWSPKEEKAYSYHEEHIRDALLKASSYLERVDSVGISTSGVVEDDLLIYPSLFASCEEKDKKETIRVLLKRICEELFPDVRFTLINDGDASALGASCLYEKTSVLGLALGTSLAGGYVNEGFLYPYLNELSKIPVNFSPLARKHYQLGVVGSSSEYLSQKGIVALAEENEVELEGSLPEKLLAIQKLAENGNRGVLQAYSELGKRLGSSVLYLSLFFDFSSVFLLGRVLSGKGGEVLLKSAQEYLTGKGSELTLFSADEKFKRLGQAYVASCLEK